LKFEEYEFKSKLQQSEGDISNFEKQLERNAGSMQSNNKKQVQPRTAINGFTETTGSLNRTAQMLCEKQNQLQATIDGLKKTVEALNQTVKLLCGQQKYVSTCKVETVSTSMWTAVTPAINTANFRPN